MKAYKFFRAGRVAPFSEVVWPEEGWVGADGALETCRSGVHACRLDQIAYWLGEELWEVELEGEVAETDLKVVAPRGRLVRQVRAWDDDARREFAAECVRRAAGYAGAELREQGITAEADVLEQATDIDGFAERAREAGEAAAEAGAGDAVDLAAFVADAAGYANAGDTPGAAFVAAHAARVHAPPGVDDPFAAERQEQARWLVARLGLSGDGA